MKILLIGPYFANGKHGSEPGIYDALIKLGCEVKVWDHRQGKAVIVENITANIMPKSVMKLLGTDFDFVLVPGPGLPDIVLDSELWKNLVQKQVKRILWNSEPVQLKQYKDKLVAQKENFTDFFTFGEQELGIYKSLGIQSVNWLPQAFNPKWYKPMPILPKHDLIFIGSSGGKWSNREHFLKRVAQNYKVNTGVCFNATEVNKVYNEHKAVLNLGLYIKELGPIEDLKASDYQQRVMESMGSCRVCITHEISGTKLFKDRETIVYYDKDNLEEQIDFALENWKELQNNIFDIRENHSFKVRMIEMLSKLDL